MYYPEMYFVDGDNHKIEKIEQYQRWSVFVKGKWKGSIVLDENDPLELKCEYSSEEGTFWVIPDSKEYRIKNRIKALYGSTGKITAYLKTESNKILSLGDYPKAMLDIKPANMTEKQFAEMIQDIGMLAASTIGLTEEKINIPLSEESDQESAISQELSQGNHLIVTATKLINLAQVFKKNWQEIQKRPLKDIKNELGIVNNTVNKANIYGSPKALINLKLNPSNTKYIGITKNESLNCSENQFLCHILDYYLGIILDSTIKLLQENNKELNNLVLYKTELGSTKLTCFSNSEDSEKYKEWKVKYNNFNNKQAEFSGKSKELQEISNWAKQIRKSKLFYSVNTVDNPVISLRLTENLYYGALYREWSGFKSQLTNNIQKRLALIELIQSNKVLPAWNIYELWCFIQLYYGFMQHLRAYPPKGYPNLFDCLIVDKTMGAISIPKDKGTEFRLERNFSEDKKIEIIFKYDQEYNSSKKRPDIQLEIKDENGYSHKHCFDAKYHNFAEEAQREECFINDIIVVARDKYLNDGNFKSSFILHPYFSIKNEYNKYDYWGAVPFSEVVNSSTIKNYVGHTYGGIYFAPNGERANISINNQIVKIIRLLLQYHNDINLVCCLCGSDHIEKIDIQNKKSQGNIYHCSQCNELWLKHWCSKQGHKLLKCNDSFHQFADCKTSRNNWFYRCPECGDTGTQ